MRKVRLGSVLKEEKTKIGKPDGSGLDLIGVSNEFGLQVSRAQRIPDLSRYKIIKTGWFAYNPMRVNVGSIGIAQGPHHEGIVSPDYVVFSCSEKILPDYLLFFLKSDIGLEAINKNASGAVRKRLYFSDLARIELNVPSIEKQIEILGSVKKIESMVIQLQDPERIGKVTQLKQSILQEAIQGKLTEEWRALRQAQQAPLEPASELLKRIQTEKARLIKEKKIKKEKPLPPITDSEKPFELPEGWEWCRLGEICSKTGSGSTPSGGKSIYQNEGVKFIRSQNVYDDGLKLEGVAFISEKIHQKMKGTIVEPEDLLLNITGGSIGRCCSVPKDFDEGNINQHVAIIRPFFEFIGYFIHKLICSPYFQEQIIKAQTGAGREGLPKNKMDNILIALPGKEEQKAIVEKVESLMEKCRALEEEISQSEHHAQMLMQAVLKEAFEN
jgi:type I restriction enzyme S subunit